FQQANGYIRLEQILLGIVPVIIAAFCYPLGDRKMMEDVKDRLDTFQRVLGMTLASMPLWFIVGFTGFITVGPPSMSQIVQSFIVAISSGVIATVLFFFATELVRNHQTKLAAVEATQSTLVIFVMIGEMIFLEVSLPNLISLIGICMIIVGMVLHS